VLTISCTLIFSDGQTATGRVCATHAGETYPIEYSGACGRLALRPPDGTPCDLELVFRLLSDMAQGRLLVQKSGAYESKAERILAA
jgi:hypothetical protein